MNLSPKAIETRTEKIWMEDGVVYAVNKTVEQHLIEDARENVLAAKHLSKGKPYPLLLDIRNSKHVSIEARKYYISSENNGVLACAFIIDSPVSLIIGRMFMGINRTPFPTQLFRSNDKALLWLKKVTAQKIEHAL